MGTQMTSIVALLGGSTRSERLRLQRQYVVAWYVEGQELDGTRSRDWLARASKPPARCIQNSLTNEIHARELTHGCSTTSTRAHSEY
jgi:hypothetical protein